MIERQLLLLLLLRELCIGEFFKVMKDYMNQNDNKLEKLLRDFVFDVKSLKL